MLNEINVNLTLGTFGYEIATLLRPQIKQYIASKEGATQLQF